MKSSTNTAWSSSALIPSLLGIQDEYHYLPPEALQRVAERLSVPMIQVHQVAEFYKAFSLEPRGKHIITVCLGTACHVAGGDRLVDHIGRMLEIETGGTTTGYAVHPRSGQLSRLLLLGAGDGG